MSPTSSEIESLLKTADSDVTALCERCTEGAPIFGVRKECFIESLQRTIEKYLVPAADGPLSLQDVRQLLEQIQAEDLFMAIACARGSERAWWEFDQQHRSYMERVARHLAKTDVHAQEVIDQVYVELYGTKVVDGERLSKFSTYSGRGTLRGWLRTVIWHSIVDLHRAGCEDAPRP